VALLCCLVAPALCQSSQSATPSTATPSDRPIPDGETLLNEVREHQKDIEDLRRHYTYHMLQTTDDVDANGDVKKKETEELNFEFVDGVPVDRLVKRDGKALSAAEEHKEDERIKKFVAHVKEVRAKNPNANSEGIDMLSIRRLLELATISNPRRIQLAGRNTIVFDYTGNPSAHAKGIDENALKKLTGSLWIDEKDREVVRMTARFDADFRIAGGLLANIEKGSSFAFEQSLVHDEIWLPATETADLDARLLMFKGIHQRIRVDYSDYLKYQVDIEMLSGRPAVQKDSDGPNTSK
jgi:hypothetical protein